MKRSTTSGPLVVILLTITAAAIIGMEMTHFWTWPSIDILPIIARFRAADFLQQDLYTNINGQLSARTYFAHLVDFMATITRVEPAEVLAYLNPFAYGFVGYGLYRFAKGIGLPALLAGAVAVGILANAITQPTLGLWSFTSTQFIPSWLAASCIILSLSLAQQQRVWAAAVALIAATAVHPTTTLLAIPLVVGLYLIERDSRWSIINGKRALVLVGVVGLVVTILFVIPNFLMTAAHITQLDGDTFHHIYVELRHPHHYLASAWPMADWARFMYAIVGWVTLIVIFYLQKESRWISDQAALFALYAILLVATHVVLVNGFHIKFITVLSPIRLTGLMWPFLLMFVAKVIYNFVPKRFILNIPWKKLDKGWVVSVTSFGMLIVLGRQGHLFYQKIQIEKMNILAEHQALYQCMQTQLPADAKVIVHPSFDSIRVRLLGQRAVYGDDIFPFNEAFVPVWWQQYTTVHGETAVADIAGQFDRLTMEQATAITAASGVSFFIVGSNAINGTEVICNTSPYKLIRIVQPTDV